MMIYRTWEKMRYIYMKGICSSCDARLLLFQLVTMISVSKAIYLLAVKHTAVISLQPYKEIACRLSSKLRKHFWKLCSFTLYNSIIAIRNTQLIVTISTLKLMVWVFFRLFFFFMVWGFFAIIYRLFLTRKHLLGPSEQPFNSLYWLMQRFNNQRHVLIHRLFHWKWKDFIPCSLCSVNIYLKYSSPFNC